MDDEDNATRPEGDRPTALDNGGDAAPAVGSPNPGEAANSDTPGVAPRDEVNPVAPSRDPGPNRAILAIAACSAFVILVVGAAVLISAKSGDDEAASPSSTTVRASTTSTRVAPSTTRVAPRSSSNSSASLTTFDEESELIIPGMSIDERRGVGTSFCNLLNATGDFEAFTALVLQGGAANGLDSGDLGRMVALAIPAFCPEWTDEARAFANA